MIGLRAQGIPAKTGQPDPRGGSGDDEVTARIHGALAAWDSQNVGGILAPEDQRGIT